MQIGGGKDYVIVQGDMVGGGQLFGPEIVALVMGIVDMPEKLGGEAGDMTAPGFSGGGRHGYGENQSQRQQGCACMFHDLPPIQIKPACVRLRQQIQAIISGSSPLLISVISSFN